MYDYIVMYHIRQPSGCHLAVALALALLNAAPLPAQTPAPGDSLLVSTAWLEAHLADPGLVVVEVGRDRGAYESGHVPGARFISLSAIVTEREGLPYELPAPEELAGVLAEASVPAAGRVVICGDPLPAARMFFTLDYLGLGHRAALLDGGCALWRHEGRPLSLEIPTKGAVPPPIRPRPEILVDAEWLASRLPDSTLALVDARPPDEFAGVVSGADVLRPGHIPNAANLPWPYTLRGPGPATYKDPAVLRALLRRVGLQEGREGVVYCRVGVQASVVYFVARYLGFHPKLYDGAFVDWSQRIELPVAREPRRDRGSGSRRRASRAYSRCSSRRRSTVVR